MITVSKRYDNIPFAHRAHKDAGPCSKIHGHSWSFVFTWGGEPDERGFILDFGSLVWLKAWLDEKFDHACVFNADDPAREFLLAEFDTLFKALVVPSCSCEGIAAYVFNAVRLLMQKHAPRGARLLSVQVCEDSRNSATYTHIEHAHGG